MRRPLLLSLVAVLLVPSASAQRQSVSVVGARTQFTSFGHTGRTAGVSYQRDLAPWLAVEAEVAATRSDATDPLLFTDRSFGWNRRAHEMASLGVVVTPVAVDGLGARHRLGVVGAVGVRRRSDQLVRGVFYPAAFEGVSPDRASAVADSLADAWEAFGPDFEAYQLRVPEGSSEAPSGLYVGFTEPARATDVGWVAGLAYEVRAGRVAAGARAVYRRYLDQNGRIGGANALDVSVRLGYRF